MEIRQAVVRTISRFGIDWDKPYQSISFIGMSEFRRDVSIKEFVEVLEGMEGVVLDTDRHEIQVPTGYFR